MSHLPPNTPLLSLTLERKNSVCGREPVHLVAQCSEHFEHIRANCIIRIHMYQDVSAPRGHQDMLHSVHGLRRKQVYFPVALMTYTDSWLDLFVLWFIIHWHIWLCSSNCGMQQQRSHLMVHKWINKSRWLGHLNAWHLLMGQLREQCTNAQPAIQHHSTKYTPPTHTVTFIMQNNIDISNEYVCLTVSVFYLKVFRV